MKIKLSFKLLMVMCVVSLCLYSCKGSKNRNKVSTSTGWHFNDPKYGDIERVNFIPGTTIGPNLVLIAGGTFVMGSTQDQVMTEWDNVPRRVTVNSFYMDQTEVSNHNYCEYLFWLHRVFGEVDNSEQRAIFTKALPDTMVWREALGYNEPLITLYLRHPAYQDYPVVGVSWRQASDFCIWRSDRVNEKRMLDEGYITELDLNPSPENYFNTETYTVGLYDLSSSPNKKMDGKKASYQSGTLLPNYRLPSEAEWEYAALGLVGNSYGSNIESRRIYPWNGNYVRVSNPKDKNYGQLADNFKRGRGDYMGVAGHPDDGYAIPAPTGSFAPNDYGLYNMAGNVSEWVQDVYRPLSFEDMNDFSPFRGNVFLVNVTDPTTGLPVKDPVTGQVQKRAIEDPDYEDLTSLNFKKSDYINYKDGDWESLLVDYKDVSKKWSEPDEYYGTDDMYTSWDEDEPANIRSLITDKSRVVKGGSWNDPAYYLSPSTRRYLDEDRAASYIGFRCAMNNLGGGCCGEPK
ncbi:MAG: SUMF1/EgtB/PvdO family nonheme iron enzyme [Bacteroidales bacterium]|nr:SUMF1/EgtB/PvdO family nonheme iron enzyme [Bacteroidales bacterium]